MDGNSLGYVPSLRHNFELLDRNSGRMRLLLVHGMSNHPFGDETQFSTLFHTTANRYDSLEPVLVRLAHEPPTAEVDLRNTLIQEITKVQFPEFIKTTSGDLHCTRRLGPKPEDLQIILAPQDSNKVLGYVLRIRLQEDQGNRILEFNLCSWAMQSALHKERVYSAVGDASHPGVPETKFSGWGALGNRALKEGLVNWGLTDAAVYVGLEQEDFQWAVAQGLARTIAGLDARKDSVAIVTASLGSTITIDALARLLTNSLRNQGHRFRWHSESDWTQFVDLLAGPTAPSGGAPHPMPIYMFANQYELLRPAESVRDRQHMRSKSQALAAAQENPALLLQKAITQGKIKGMEEAVPGNARLTDAIAKGHFQGQVIAFTDPDDLLSHPFPGVFSNQKHPTAGEEHLNVGCVNVYVHNPNLIYFFVLANPLNAHTSYPKNPAVQRRILAGATHEEVVQAAQSNPASN